MGRNKPGTEGHRFPRAKRVRKSLEITISDEARALLDAESEKRGGNVRSQIVEELIVAALKAT